MTLTAARRTPLLRLTLATAVLAALYGAPSAHAFTASSADAPAAGQAADQADADSAKPKAAEATKLERVMVTGSKIKGVDVENDEPLVTISRAQIDKLGVSSVDEVLATLTESGEARGRATNADQNSYANLRNIGSNRTLVLVNGHRWVGGSDIGGIVNLNTIPLAAVDHIDVLKDGGSVLYGADAMVGLINVILKDHYDGIEGRVRLGGYGEGGGFERNAQLTGGWSSGRFSGVLGLAYGKGDAVSATEYDITSVPAPYGGAGFGKLNWSDITPAGRFQTCKVALDAKGNCSSANLVGPDGTNQTYYTYDPGQTGKNWRLYDPNSDRYNANSFRDLLTPYERASVTGSMKYDFTDHVQFKLSAQYVSERVLDKPGAPQSITNAIVGGIPANNYYNLSGKPIGLIQRALTEDGGQSFSYYTQTRVLTPSVVGNFGMLGRDIDWEVGFERGTTTFHSDWANMLSISRLKNALGPSFKDANGNIVCGTPGKVLAGCVPMNPFGAGTITPDMLSYVLFNQPLLVRNNFTDSDYFAQFSTPNLFSLPAGDVGMAAGFERHREYGYTSSSQQFYAPSDVVGYARGATGGGFASNDFFTEFYVPVLKDLPLVKSLDLSIAGRYSMYDSGVNVFNKKYGVKWKITDDLAFRGSYSTGYRIDIAAIIQNNAITQGNILGSVSQHDPCSFTTDSKGKITANYYALLSPAQQATCQSYGLPAGGYNAAAAPGVTFQNRGNPQIGPEKDIFNSAGLLYSPHFIEGLDLALDYWAIKFRASLYRPSVQNMLDNCLAGVSNLCPAGWVTRDANGYVNFVRTSALNGPGGVERYRGFDFHAAYKLPTTSIGDFRFDWSTSYLASAHNFVSPNTTTNPVPLPPQSQVGVYGPLWRVRANFSVGWSRGNWSAQWTARYYSSLKERCSLIGTAAVYLCNDLGPVQFHDPSNVANDKFLPFLRGGSANRLAAYTLQDINVGYKTPWLGGGRISGGIRNLFNKRPPLSRSGSWYDLGSFGLPDRYFYVEYDQKF